MACVSTSRTFGRIYTHMYTYIVFASRHTSISIHPNPSAWVICAFIYIYICVCAYIMYIHNNHCWSWIKPFNFVISIEQRICLKSHRNKTLDMWIVQTYMYQNIVCVSTLLNIGRIYSCIYTFSVFSLPLICICIPISELELSACTYMYYIYISIQTITLSFTPA